jgi:hypothetical protein
MQKILVILLTVIGMIYAGTSLPDGAMAMLLATAIIVPALIILRKQTEDTETITNIFLLALVLRLSLGLIIHFLSLEKVFGPDAFSYHEIAAGRIDSWQAGFSSSLFEMPSAAAWGMAYVVTAIYLIFGKSILIGQTFCCVIGALTPPMVYFCSLNIFNNKRAARISGFAVAVFPSFILWSSQMLKDGLIIFLLVVIMTALISLQKRFSYVAVAGLLASMVGILSLRFYIFYMVVVAVVGSFVVGLGDTGNAVIRNFAVIILLGVGLTYVGVAGSATRDLERITDLENLQVVRQDLTKSADSSFGDDADVSTVQGAVSAIPIGFIYLIFAPFPWQIGKMSQALIFPETLVWWCLLPVMLSGMFYTIRNKLRPAIPILVFSTMLTLAYSIFQGNVGMAYRQRTQIQVFLFMFIAVGISIVLEKRENKKQLLRQSDFNTARPIRPRSASVA